jgi:tRNA (guanine-N7-)-methyltransferase
MNSSIWQDVFGNANPVEIEIGPGRGDVLLAYATAAPAINFFGIEHRQAAAERIMTRVVTHGLDNVRVIAADARCVISRLVPDRSVAAYHVYFPDPWPKRRHRKRRLLGAEFVRELARTLAPGGLLFLATDLPALLADMCGELEGGPLVRSPAPALRPRPLTGFERKYAQAGTHVATFARPASPHEAREVGASASRMRPGSGSG